MEALWRRGPLTPEGIIDEVGGPHGWAPGTVKTLITRLLRKKAIEGRREAAGYFYRPLLSRADYVAIGKPEPGRPAVRRRGRPPWSPPSPSTAR